MELKDICQYISEKVATTTLTKENYISTENMLPDKGGIVTASGVPFGNSTAFSVGDVLVSNIRPYFKKIWQANRNGGCSADVLCFRANSNVDNSYFYYLLSQQEFFDYIMSGAKGCKMPRGDKKQIMQWKVELPPLDEQKHIASVLLSLDEKIELNRRINGNLEQQAQALFKAWFVDFEPFKDGKFVDSELGRIPEGWKVGRFNNIIESTLSGDWGKERQEGNYIKKVFCLRGADIPDVKIGNKGYMPIRFILEKNFATKALTAGNLVIEISGGSPTQSTGRICRISHELLTKYNNSIVCTNFCKAIRPMVGYSSFMYYMWEKLYNEGVMFSYENGTTGIKNLDINGLTQKEPIIIPPIEVALNFEKYVDIYYNKIQKNGIESEQLSHLRDTLLPRLMSGELNVNTITE